MIKKDQKKTTGLSDQKPRPEKPQPQSEVDRAIQKLKEQRIEKEQKRGPGRPRKEQPVQEPDLEIQSGLIFKAVFVIIAARFGDHWLLTPDEIKQIDEAGNQVFKKYAPKMINYIAEVYLASVLVSIFGSKVQAHKELIAKQRARRVEPIKAEPVKDETKAKAK